MFSLVFKSSPKLSFMPTGYTDDVNERTPFCQLLELRQCIGSFRSYMILAEIC